MKRKLLVLSLDAVGTVDIEEMKRLPNFAKFFEKASGCKTVKSVYPTLTYPAHTSIITGKYPNNHRIVNNLQIQPNRKDSDWFWQRRFIKGTTVCDEAIKKGYKVASLLWPVTAKSNIQYNLPEIWPNRPYENQIVVSFLNGSPLYQLKLNQKFGGLRNGKKQPYLDNFVQQSLLYTLKEYRPDMTLVHFTDVDTNRHEHGMYGKEISDALKRHDKRLGEIIDTLKEIGEYENTNILLLGDHSQIQTHTVVYPNYIFRRKKYIKIKEGNIVDWKVLARHCDGSCYIYIKDENNMALKQEVFELLEKMKKDKRAGIEQIFTNEEIIQLGADGNATFMIEAKEGFYYQDEFDVYTKEITDEDGNFHEMKATHGYLPTKLNYTTFFYGIGPDIKEGVEIEDMCLVDEGPTMAKLVGCQLKEADGRVLEEMLK